MEWWLALDLGVPLSVLDEEDVQRTLRGWNLNNTYHEYRGRRPGEKPVRGRRGKYLRRL